MKMLSLLSLRCIVHISACRILCAVILMVCSAVLSAHTVMIRYDIIIDSEDSNTPYVQEMSVGIESGIMQEFFDNGHIVFNTPGDIIISNTDVTPSAHAHDESEIPQYIMEARTAGADILLYYRVHYSGTTQEDIQLNAVDYDFIHSNINFFINDSLNIEQESPISILDASQIIVSQLVKNDYIRSILQ